MGESDGVMMISTLLAEKLKIKKNCKFNQIQYFADFYINLPGNNVIKIFTSVNYKLSQ